MINGPGGPVRAFLGTLIPNPDPRTAIWRDVIRIDIHPHYSRQFTVPYLIFNMQYLG